MDKDDSEGLKNGNINSEMKNPKQYYTRRQNHTRVGRDGTLEHVKPDVNDGCGVSCTSDTEKIDRTNPLGLKLKKREIRKQPFTSKITDGALLNRKQGVKREWLKKETGSTVMHRGEKEELCPEVIKQEEVKEQNVMKEAKHALIARKHRHVSNWYLVLFKHFATFLGLIFFYVGIQILIMESMNRRRSLLVQ